MKKIIFIAGIILIIVIIVTMLIMPPIARSYFVKNSPELIGRQTSLKSLKLNLFKMAVNLEEFTLYEEDGETTFIYFDQLYINISPWYLLNSELVVQELLLDGLKVNIIQDDSSFNFDSMIAFNSTENEQFDSTISDTIQDDEYKFHLSNLELKRGEIYYLDSAVGEDINMVNLNMFIPYIGWNQDDATDAKLKFFFANGGFFQSDFQMDPVTGIFDAKIDISALDLSTFLGYATRQLAIDTLQGTFNTSLSVSGNTNELDSVAIDGWSNILELNITSEGGSELASVEDFYCKIKNFQPLINQFLFDTIILTKPEFHFELWDATNNISNLFPEIEVDSTQITLTADTISEQEIEQYFPLYYSLNSFEIVDGILHFSDYTYSNTFNYNLSAMEMNVDSITSDAHWIDATASMTLNNKGNLLAELGFDPSDPMELDIEYAITDFRLSDLNIYTNHYIGHDIVLGDMYYTSETKIRFNQIKSDNKLIIRDVEINNVEGGLMSLPLKLALFILKDNNNDAVLDLPVRGDLNDPSISIGTLVWNTFSNFIGRIAAAPYNFLAGLVSADPNDLKEIVYDYADTTFTQKKQRQLDLLLELEQKKEGLDIQLDYFVDMELEKNTLALFHAENLFHKNTNKEALGNEDEFLAFLRNKIKNDTVDTKEAAILLSDPAELDSLALMFSQYRVDRLKEYLTTINDSTNIKVNSYQPNVPKNMGASPYFKVEYAIVGERD